MDTGYKKHVAIVLISFVPLMSIIFKNFVFYRKDWRYESGVQFEVIFWFVRMVLSPLLVWYILRFWAPLSRPARLLFLQIAGLFFFLALHWILSYGIHRF